MRSFASSLTGLAMLAMLLVVGGAWTPSSSDFIPYHIPAGSEPFPALRAVNTIVEPVVQSPERSFLGCQVPLDAAQCSAMSYRTATPVEIDPHLLVPDTVESVEDWRPLVARFFAPGDVDRALAIMRCESGGNPLAKNPRSSASGLFQHLGSEWDRRTYGAGWFQADIFDPVANVAVAAWLVYEGGGWSHWSASGHCW